jgi:hypothetical protein
MIPIDIHIIALLASLALAHGPLSHLPAISAI